MTKELQNNKIEASDFAISQIRTSRRQSLRLQVHEKFKQQLL